MNLFRNRPLVVTIVIVIILIVLIVITGAGKGSSNNTTAIGTAFVPLQRFFYGASSSVEAAFSKTEESAALDGNTPSVQGGGAQVGTLSYEELLAENERLSKMLDYKQNNETQEVKVANIIGKEPSNWFDIFTIDLGAKDGIEENMPVVTPDGLVGRVEETGLNWSKVIGIIDGRSSVAVIMERTRDIGVVKGRIEADGLSASLSMNYLPLDTDVLEGDVVLTSGYDQLYPKGLVVGEVLQAADDQTGGKAITIRPSVDFRRLEEVMVVVSVQGDAAYANAIEDIADDTAAAQPLPTESVAPDQASAG